MNDDRKEKLWYEDIIRKCPMLYTGVNKPITESLIPFGFECGSGWEWPLELLSYKLEMLNRTYWPKYKVRIEAAQVKEKFGTLQYYYDIVYDQPSWFLRTISKCCKQLSNVLNKLDFKMIKVVDRPAGKDIKDEEITYVQFVEDEFIYRNCANVYVYKSKDGKYYRHSEYDVMERCHYEPTKHKILFALKSKLIRWHHILENSAYDESDVDRVYVHDYMRAITDDLIETAEMKCAELCEDCGCHIGTDQSPACVTTGWIRYICKDCASKLNHDYMMNGERWNGTKRIKTKAQIKTEHTKHEAEMKKKGAEYDKERAKYEAKLKKAKAAEQKSKKSKIAKDK